MLLEIANDNMIQISNEKADSASSAGKYYKHGFIRKRKFKKRFRDENFGERAVSHIDESDTSLCVSLWRSVIVQALYDVSGKGGNEARKLVRAESNAWFSNLKPASNDNNNCWGQTDFEYVCELANLNPSTVLKVVKEVRENGVEVLENYNSRTFRKIYSNREGRKVLKTASQNLNMKWGGNYGV